MPNPQPNFSVLPDRQQANDLTSRTDIKYQTLTQDVMDAMLKKHFKDHTKSDYSSSGVFFSGEDEIWSSPDERTLHSEQAILSSEDEIWSSPDVMPSNSDYKNFMLQRSRLVRGEYIVSDTIGASINVVVSQLNEHYNSALASIRDIENDLDKGDIHPPQHLIAEVGELVRHLYEKEKINLPLEIHAMPEGDIVLNVSPQRQNMMFLHCDADGSAYCMVKLQNKRETRSYNSIISLPDAFVSDALRRLQESSE